MKITAKLPQFENDTTLLVVTGAQEAVFYIAENGELKQVDSFVVERPKYTDLEGHFETRSGGDTMKAGSPFEPTDVTDAAVRGFLTKLKKELAGVSRHHDIKALYIFCPSYIKNEITKQIPYELENKKQGVIIGNYYHIHPFDLLKKIQKKNRINPIKPISEAAKKILDRFRK